MIRDDKILREMYVYAQMTYKGKTKEEAERSWEVTCEEAEKLKQTLPEWTYGIDSAGYDKWKEGLK